MKSQLTKQEFDELLEDYQKQNPEKYEIKKANGEFDKFRQTLPEEKVIIPEMDGEIKAVIKGRKKLNN